MTFQELARLQGSDDGLRQADLETLRLLAAGRITRAEALARARNLDGPLDGMPPPPLAVVRGEI